MEQVSVDYRFLPVCPPLTAAGPLTWEFFRRVQNFNPFHRIPLSVGVSELVKKNLDCTVCLKLYPLLDCGTQKSMFIARGCNIVGFCGQFL